LNGKFIFYAGSRALLQGFYHLIFKPYFFLNLSGKKQHNKNNLIFYDLIWRAEVGLS